MTMSGGRLNPNNLEVPAERSNDARVIGGELRNELAPQGPGPIFVGVSADAMLPLRWLRPVTGLLRFGKSAHQDDAGTEGQLL